jgi:hypothetical protein
VKVYRRRPHADLGQIRRLDPASASFYKFIERFASIIFFFFRLRLRRRSALAEAASRKRRQ